MGGAVRRLAAATSIAAARPGYFRIGIHARRARMFDHPMNARTQIIHGQQSWTLAIEGIEVAVTRQAGHLGPARFRVGRRWVEPFDLAPWAEEKLPADTPPLLRVMRGDFFCMPFGGNATEYNGERHPPHGETANGKWKLESLAGDHLHLSLRTAVREGRVDKHVRLTPGHRAIYVQHVISGMAGRMAFGHHPILKVPDGAAARVSVSPFKFGQVYPGALEDPARGGYSILKPGAKFTTLERVPRIDGGIADLTIYPSREGYEDLVLLASDPALPFAWTALAVPAERYLWFSLKDPRVLPSTVFWMSNGGRHYPPWNGRHRRAIGLEEVVANFDLGLAESARPNALSRAGVPTSVRLDPRRPFAINFIMAVAEVPAEFDAVKSIRSAVDGKSVQIASHSGCEVSAPLDIGFLAASPRAD